MASCESWLDEDPQYTINTKTQFSTVENAKQALMGCYGYTAQWAADLSALLENYQKTAAAVRGRAITGWREENGQIVTTFEGGARLLIDYENKTAVLQ